MIVAGVLAVVLFAILGVERQIVGSLLNGLPLIDHLLLLGELDYLSPAVLTLLSLWLPTITTSFLSSRLLLLITLLSIWSPTITGSSESRV